MAIERYKKEEIRTDRLAEEKERPKLLFDPRVDIHSDQWEGMRRDVMRNIEEVRMGRRLNIDEARFVFFSLIAKLRGEDPPVLPKELYKKAQSTFRTDTLGAIMDGAHAKLIDPILLDKESLKKNKSQLEIRMQTMDYNPFYQVCLKIIAPEILEPFLTNERFQEEYDDILNCRNASDREERLMTLRALYPHLFSTIPREEIYQAIEEGKREMENVGNDIWRIVMLTFLAAPRAWVDEQGYHIELDPEPTTSPSEPLPISRIF